MLKPPPGDGRGLQHGQRGDWAQLSHCEVTVHLRFQQAVGRRVSGATMSITSPTRYSGRPLASCQRLRRRPRAAQLRIIDEVT